MSDSAIVQLVRPLVREMAPYRSARDEFEDFEAQKILGILHLLGGILLFVAASAESFNLFYPYIFIYMLLYMPTLALANSVAFHQMKNLRIYKGDGDQDRPNFSITKK